MFGAFAFMSNGKAFKDFKRVYSYDAGVVMPGGVSTFTLIPVALHNVYSYLHQIVKCMT